MGSVPANYPPPWRVEDALAVPTDSDPIEVGLLVVGAGPAGLACAIRLGQLCEEDPETAERLGDVPVAVLEKGKGPGSHLLSGAVLNPRGLQRLFKGRRRLDELPLFDLVGHESVYYLTPKRAMRIPTPPTMRNHGNYVASLSQLGRFLAQEAEEVGATILPETPAEKLIVTDGRVRGVRTADRGRGRNGEELAELRAGRRHPRPHHRPRRGDAGPPDRRRDRALRPPGRQPAGLGARREGGLERREAARPRDPHDGLAAALARPYREFGGSFVYPMGDDMVTIGMVVGLDYRDAELSVHDLLQELKTHKKIRKILAGGERLEWGAKTIPEGGFLSLPKRLHAPGLLLTGDGVGLVNVPALKGIHYAIESGRLAAEAAWQAIQPGEAVGRRGALQRYDDSLRDSFVWKDLKRVRNMRPAFAKGFWLGSALAGGAYASFGKMPPKDQSLERDAEVDLITTDRAKFYPVADGKLTFDKLSSVFASGNKTRDDQPSHIRIETRVPRDVAQMWSRLCPAHVYEVGEEDAGKVVVHVTPSNCVQCGAITAKGGRLTPPEGGSGPEYTKT